MVGYALEIADGFQQLRGLLALAVRQGVAAQLHQIGADDVLIVVAALLVLPDGPGQLRGVASQGGQGVFQGADGAGGHLPGHVPGLAQGQGGGGQQAGVQLGRLLPALGVGHQPDGQLFQQVSGRQQHGGAQDVEHRVGDGDAVHGGGPVQNRRGKDGLDDAEQGQQHHHADDVEHQVHHGGPAGVFVGAHGGQHGRDAGADVLAHDDGDGSGVADAAGNGQGLQNAHGGGGGLDDARQHRAHQHAQNGIAEHQEQLGELRHVLQAGHGPAHGLHAEHQGGEAQQDGAGVLFLVGLAEHIEDDADQGQHRGKGRGLQQLHPGAAAVDARQAQQPRGDGGAHIGAHDDVDGLAQGHQPRVHEAHHHHRGGGGALDNGGDAQARQEAHEHPAGHLIQQGPQLAAGPAFQGLAHQVHAEQEQTQPAHQRQRIENSHRCYSLYSSFLHFDTRSFTLLSIQGLCQIRCNE